MKPCFILVHSPFLSPFSWSRVARELSRCNLSVLVPELAEPYQAGQRCWQQDAAGVAEAIASLLPEQPFVLVGHSGAGTLLPAIGQLVGQRPAAYLFVDAGIPVDGLTRLDLLRLELPAAAAQLEPYLQAGGCYPSWTEADLAPLLPDAAMRERLLAELQPQGLAFFTEPIPVATAWPDAPCAYLQLSEGYAYSAAQAKAAGWPLTKLTADHFAILTQPELVAEAILELVRVEAS